MMDITLLRGVLAVGGHVVWTAIAGAALAAAKGEEMKNKEMLRKIYYENKAINRNMQRLVNIGLIGILGGIAKEAKASDDPKAKILVKMICFMYVR